MKALEELKRKLKIAEANIGNEMVQKDPLLKKSATKKIAELKSEIANYFVKGKKDAPKKEEKVVKAPKKEVAKKEKVEKTATVKGDKDNLVVDGFKAGDKVSFLERGSNDTKKGVILKIGLSKGKYFAQVKTTQKEGWVSVGKLSHV